MTDGNAGGDGDASASPAVVAVGGAMIDEYYTLSNLPAPDGGAYVREEREGFGGVAGNVASALARLGRSTGVVARLGDDDRADAVEADLAERGIDAERVRRGPEASTYSMVLRAGGQLMVVTGGRSAAALRLREGDWPLLREAEVVATTAYTPDAVTSALVDARIDGEIDRLTFDLSGPLAELTDRGTAPATVDRAVATADLVQAGEVALASYCDHHDAADPVALLRDRGVRRAALTRGAAGATLVTPDREVSVDAVDVDAVDPTGAGDAFHAGLVDAWLLDGRSPAAAGRFAAAVAALNCTGDGARGGLPSREAVADLVE